MFITNILKLGLSNGMVMDFFQISQISAVKITNNTMLLVVWFELCLDESLLYNLQLNQSNQQ